MSGIVSDLTRVVILFSYDVVKRLDPLLKRAIATEIGFSGHVSQLDKHYAEQNNIKPLNRFEKWVLAPLIEEEKKRCQFFFIEAVRDVTGEDPDDWC